MNVSSIIQDYAEYERKIGDWTVQIVVYALGEKYVTIVNNLDPGATICRVSARTREASLRDAIEQANALLSRTVLCEPRKAACGLGPLAVIEFKNGNESASYSVDTFLQLPMEFRVQCMMQDKLSYRDSNGVILPTAAAVRELSAACS